MTERKEVTQVRRLKHRCRHCKFGTPFGPGYGNGNQIKCVPPYFTNKTMYTVHSPKDSCEYWESKYDKESTDA